MTHPSKVTEIYYNLGDPEEDGGKVFRETMAKEDELYLCILGQEMPLINGKRKKYNNITMGEICEKGRFGSCCDMNMSVICILENEWGYAKIQHGEKYDTSK